MVRLRTCFLAALLACCRAASAQSIVFPAHDVDIVVTVHDAGTADVIERYALTAPPGDTRWTIFASPCTSVDPIAAMVDDRKLAVAVDERRREPWTEVRLASPPRDRAGAGDTLILQYRVRISGTDATIPIVLPAAVLQRSEGARGASVRVDVRVDDEVRDARVLMPRFERTDSPRAWRARFLAVPAFVRVSLPGGAACDRRWSGSAGGLEWRTTIFAGTMALWVPLYLWWFGRDRE